MYPALESHVAASIGRTSSGTDMEVLAEAFGHTIEEFASIHQNDGYGLSCDNPLAIATLRKGETVIDFGCGTGSDVVLAAEKVGPRGLVISVVTNDNDLTEVQVNKDKLGDNNVRLIKAPITMISPLSDGTMDCILSNCQVNMVPEAKKGLVFKEMYRLLKPGGRIALSDTLIKGDEDLPADLKHDIGRLVRCVSGASLVSDYEKYLEEAGFKNIFFVDNRYNLNAHDMENPDWEQGSNCCLTCNPGPAPTNVCRGTSAGSLTSVASKFRHISIDLNVHVGSYSIYAVKA